MKFVTLLLVISMLAVLAGCQADFIGPSSTWKVLHKGENNNQEHLSRNAGITTATGYGPGRQISWGMKRKGEK